MFYVYILKLNNNQLYTGFTTDLKRRVSEHKSGNSSFTSKLINLQDIKLKLPFSGTRFFELTDRRTCQIHRKNSAILHADSHLTQELSPKAINPLPGKKRHLTQDFPDFL